MVGSFFFHVRDVVPLSLGLSFLGVADILTMVPCTYVPSFSTVSRFFSLSLVSSTGL